MLKVAILDDYTRIALSVADWSAVRAVGEVQVFDRHLPEDEAVTALAPFDVICTMRERMALPRSVIERLPNLKLITITGARVPNIDMVAASEHGIVISHSNTQRRDQASMLHSTPELAWGLILSSVRHIAFEDRQMRAGGWQHMLGVSLHGRTLGLLGLGRLGKRMAELGQAFGMRIIAWSQNLTTEDAAQVGVQRVEKDELFRTSDVLSIHLVLSDRTRGLVTARELALMKPSAYLVNTSRGPIVEEAALVAALREHRIAGAGLDVFDQEPLPADHSLRQLDNVTLTPHLGYVTEDTMRSFYSDTAEAIVAFAHGAPIRVANPEALHHSKHYSHE